MIAVAWLVPSPAKALPGTRPSDGMFTPGAVTVRYLCRDEKGATRPFESTAPTETTPRHTPGSSTGLPFCPALPAAATTIAPLPIA